MENSEKSAYSANRWGVSIGSSSSKATEADGSAYPISIKSDR